MADLAGDLGMSSDELVALLPVALGLLTTGGNEYAQLKDGLRRWAAEDPIDALVAAVLGGGLAFYLAERTTSQRCETPWDGILYVATCLSAGHDSTYPTTPTGHAIASLVRTFGPALAASAFARPAAEARATAAAAAEVDRQILARLDDIVHLLGDPRR